MLKRLVIFIMVALLSVSLIISVSASPLEENDQTQAAQLKLDAEQRNLGVARSIIGNYEEYGSLYVDKNKKIVLALSKEDSKTDDIVNKPLRLMLWV